MCVSTSRGGRLPVSRQSHHLVFAGDGPTIRRPDGVRPYNAEASARRSPPPGSRTTARSPAWPRRRAEARAAGITRSRSSPVRPHRRRPEARCYGSPEGSGETTFLGATSCRSSSPPGRRLRAEVSARCSTPARPRPRIDASVSGGLRCRPVRAFWKPVAAVAGARLRATSSDRAGRRWRRARLRLVDHCTHLEDGDVAPSRLATVATFLPASDSAPATLSRCPPCLDAGARSPSHQLQPGSATPRRWRSASHWRCGMGSPGRSGRPRRRGAAAGARLMGASPRAAGRSRGLEAPARPPRLRPGVPLVSTVIEGGSLS